MRILLTNDDGIEAPGLQALWQAVNEAFGEDLDVAVVAPDCGRSECGHSVTTGRPLHIQQVRPGWFSVDGTPVDCVRVALGSVSPDVDLVISGVNAGANLGVDLLVSGTFAAAREAAIENVPAMAVSHYRHPDVPVTWDHVPRWMLPTLKEFAERARDRSDANSRVATLWNVNLPAICPSTELPERVHCQVDRWPRKQVVRRVESKISFESDFHGRLCEADTDVERCFAGALTISEITPGFGIL